MPPLPPAAKAVIFAFSILITFALIVFVGFMAIEFTAEMAGHPIRFAEQDPAEGLPLLTEQDTDGKMKDPFELITPKNQTLLQGPEVVVIYTVRTVPPPSPALRINDVPYPWEIQYGNNTWFARLQLQAGRHYLQAGEADAEFFVEMPDSTQHLSELWLRHQPHRDTDKVGRCIVCHEMPGGSNNFLLLWQAGTIGAWKGTSSCFACHDEEKYTSDHRFILPRTDRDLRCVRCHTIH